MVCRARALEAAVPAQRRAVSSPRCVAPSAWLWARAGAAAPSPEEAERQPPPLPPQQQEEEPPPQPPPQPPAEPPPPPPEPQQYHDRQQRPRPEHAPLAPPAAQSLDSAAAAAAAALSAEPAVGRQKHPRTRMSRLMRWSRSHRPKIRSIGLAPAGIQPAVEAASLPVMATDSAVAVTMCAPRPEP